jgi:hypothetical protein
MGEKKLCKGTELAGIIPLPTGLNAELGERTPVGKALGEVVVRDCTGMLWERLDITT